MLEIENLKIGNDGTLHIVGNEDIVANAWAAGKTYVKNKSYVIREHRLYVCNVTHTSVEPFDATKWTEITVIGAIDNALDMTDTASGAIATFESEYALPLRDLEIEINAVQEGTGTPSPDNVRPITGFTGANIHVADNETPHIIDNVTAITWQSEAGTVYGGSLDVTSGKLVVSWAAIDLGSLTWLKQPTEDPNANVFRCNIPNRKYGKTESIGFPAKISMYNYVLNATQSGLVNGLGNFECGGQITNNAFMIRDDRYNTAEDFKTAMDGVYLYYELATPQTIQLTPTQISAIVGTNNVFTDTNGDTSLEYYTKRGEQTVRIAEGVAVDVINNKSIDNLTTNNKTLVGAVNEVDGKTKPTTVTPTFNSSQSNYSTPFNNTRVYKIGNVVYFTSTIQVDTPYGSNPGQDVYSGLPKPYANDSLYMGFCAWNVTTNNMRVIVTSDGKLQCRGGNTGTAYDVSFSYVCQ